jgi:hypothetical protein
MVMIISPKYAVSAVVGKMKGMTSSELRIIVLRQALMVEVLSVYAEKRNRRYPASLPAVTWSITRCL